MKKVFLTILAVLLIAVIGGAVYVFAFDKTIPTNWVSGQVEDVKKSKLTEDDKMPSMKVSFETIVYTKDDNNKVSSYFSTKYYRELKNKSTKDVEGYEIVMKDYNSEGKLSEEATFRYYIEDGKYYKANGELKEEIENFNEVGLFFILVSNYYEDDMTLKADIIDAIDNNLDHVSQKGLNITLHLHKEEDNRKLDLAISYNIISKKVVKLDFTSDVYSEGALASRTHEVVEY